MTKKKRTFKSKAANWTSDLLVFIEIPVFYITYIKDFRALWDVVLY